MSFILPSCLLAALAWICLRLYVRFFGKSPLDNVPGPPRASLLQGNMGQLFHRDAWDFMDELANRYEPVSMIHDLFGRRALHVHDPRALTSILLRDQDVYEETQWLIDWDKVIFGPGLLSTMGSQHRRQRKVLNPVFSVAHMRHITPIFYDVGERLARAIGTQVRGGKTEVDVLNWMSRAALELIGQGGLGYSFDPLLDDRHNEFGDALTRLLPCTFDLIICQLTASYWANLGSPGLRRWILDRIPIAKIQELKNIVDVMDQQSRAIFAEKKAALEKGDEALAHQFGEGKDILSVMLKANMQTSSGDRLEDEELIGQISTLVLAATDTTTNALSRILHVLAMHPDEQQKLRTEITQARHGERVSYDSLMNLPYLDAVIRESLRLYSPATFVIRETRKDIVMPLSRPIRGVDGSIMEQILVPKDTSVMIAIRACNRNKEIWGEDAAEWKPERWLSPLPDKVTQARIPGVYSSLLTFIGGSRSCIGFKFAELEMKVMLSTLLEKFEFSLSEKDVRWNISGVVYPSVGMSDKPSLPLMVQPVAAVA